jgi:UDP-N-acetylmuramoyl-L-alanyl-D-glutamate--2,6-diaminopimelate ligase
MEEKFFSQLLDKDNIFYIGNSKPVSYLSNNSKDIKENTLFFAIKGTKVDGHNFIEDAVSNGATGVVVERKDIADWLREKYPFLNIALVENTRITQAITARKFFNYPDKKLKVIGVTGTNGKTTVSHLIAQFLEKAGTKTGIIGTTGHKIGEKIIFEGMTTPDTIQWYFLLDRFYKEGAEYVIAEVSSHALDQYRVYGTEFYGGIFTNLSQDHLDYHKTLNNYFQAKSKLFEYIKKGGIISINIDDIYGQKLFRGLRRKNKISYGMSEKADFKISSYNLSINSTEFRVEYKGEVKKVKTNLLDLFNIYNLSAAFSFLLKDGMDINFLIENAQNLKPVKGRFEVIEGSDFVVINDYAHTPDALEKILSSLNEIKQNRIIVVFGAGGDRDKEKRPLMGHIASTLADIVIITSDNPRSENPEDIIKQIKEGINKNANAIDILDREEAIKKAIFMAEKGDIVLIAGKGHENYQIIGNKKFPFDDTEVAKKYIKKRQQKLPRQEKL